MLTSRNTLSLNTMRLGAVKSLHMKKGRVGKGGKKPEKNEKEGMPKGLRISPLLK